MTPSEFKAWFEGFTESMDGPPSLKQWEKIQARVKQITGQPVTYPVYVDRYLPSVPYWRNPIYPYGICTNAVASVQNNAAAPAFVPDLITMKVGGSGDGGTVFDSHVAMTALGRADAEHMARA